MRHCPQSFSKRHWQIICMVSSMCPPSLLFSILLATPESHTVWTVSMDNLALALEGSWWGSWRSPCWVTLMLVCLSTKITASIGIFIQLPSLVPVSAPFSCSSPERPLGFLSLSFLLELASWRHQQEIWQLDKSKIPVYIFSCFPSYGDSVDCPGSNTMS